MQLTFGRMFKVVISIILGDKSSFYFYPILNQAFCFYRLATILGAIK